MSSAKSKVDGPVAAPVTAQAQPQTNGINRGGAYIPPKPAMSADPPRFVVIGAGSRGRAYARAVQQSCNGYITAVAEPDDYKREQFARLFITTGEQHQDEGVKFRDWHDFIEYETRRRARVQAGEAGVPRGWDGAFVCVLDEMHRDAVVALSQLGGLHIMCEKPLATTMADCVAMFRALAGNVDEAGRPRVFSIGHVLRYSPHNAALRKLLLEDRAIGDVLSVNHTEPVGWWHFTHSYVRGNWRRESTTAPSLLTKSCHDIDVLLWLLCTPTSYINTDTNTNAVPHLPSTVSSSGALQYFRKSRKPAAAGAATNCLSCPAEPACKYSAKRIYASDKLWGLGTGNAHWPVSIVVPDIESHPAGPRREAALLAELARDYDAATTPDAEIASRNWFGRCVYESDNDVCDEQVVTITWDEDPLPQSSSTAAAAAAVGAPGTTTATTSDGTTTVTISDPLRGRGAKTATFHMVAQTKRQCERYTHVYGTDGELYADSQTIVVEDFRTGKTTTHTPRSDVVGNHGGGDVGLAQQFVLAVDRCKNHGWEADRAQREVVGCTIEEVIRSHAMVFCAEEARTGKKVVDWKEWWAREVDAHMRKGKA